MTDEQDNAGDAKREGAVLLKKVEALLDPKAKKKNDLIGWLYETLTILDGKANGLLLANSIFAALAGVIADRAEKSLGSGGCCIFSVLLGPGPLFCILLFVFSSILCMFIAHVNWKFLGKINLQRLASFDDEITDLGVTVIRRTRIFWCAWVLTLLGFILTFLVVLALMLNRSSAAA